jgi:hypothetical protein
VTPINLQQKQIVVKAKQQFGTIFVKSLPFRQAHQAGGFFHKALSDSVQNRNSGDKNQAEILRDRKSTWIELSCQNFLQSNRNNHWNGFAHFIYPEGHSLSRMILGIV